MLCRFCGHENAIGSAFCNACAERLDAPDSVVESGESHVSGLSVDFVGRPREMSQLATALDEARSGQGRLVMLVGEPGIGKTRMAEEFASHAKDREALVLWGRCHEQQGMPPFWPWVQAIRSYVREREPEQLRSELGASAPAIAEIVPDVSELLPNLKRLPELESPEQARFRLFDAITTFLKNLAVQANGLALLLDDLHWADKPSLLLLEFLSQELADSRIMIVGTYRDIDLSRQHPLAESLGQLTRAHHFRRLPLRGLDIEDEGQLIQVTSKTEPNKQFVELVHSRTEGNPLFIGELLRMLEQEGNGDQDDAAFRLPEGVREVIGRRLNRLTERCNYMLTVASVIGREFEFSQLVDLVDDATEDDLLESLDEAVAARIISEAPESLGRYQFTHALIMQTLTSELPTTRRVRLHARIALALEEQFGSDVGSHAGRLAYHFGEAQLVLGIPKLVSYSLLAGQQALASNAHEEALRHFQRGVDAKEGQPIDAETATLLFGLGRAQAATVERHQSSQAGDTLRQAFNYFAEIEDIDSAVAVAQLPFQAEIGDMSDVILRAVELAPPDSEQAARLLPRYLRQLFQSEENHDRALEALDQALAIAHRDQDAVLEMKTLEYAGHGSLFQLKYQEAVEYSLQALKLASQLDDVASEEHASWVAARALLLTGDLERARPLAEASLALSDQLRFRQQLAHAHWLNAEVSDLAGDLRAGRALNDRALELTPSSPIPLSWRTIIEYETGNIEQGEAYLERLLQTMSMAPLLQAFHFSGPAVVIPIVARITGSVDRFDAALAAAEMILGNFSTVSIFRDGAAGIYSRVAATAGLALMAVQLGDAKAAVAQYDVLKSHQGALVPLVMLCVDRTLGLLARTLGKLDDAARHFEDAIAFCRKAGYRPELAWSLYDYADMLLDRDKTGDRRKAEELVDESNQTASGIGMMPLIERVAALRERLDARPSPKPQYPDGLTEREVEVLRLIAAGRSNREIGDDLFISVNTVARHVNHVFSKIDASNRAEAASYATRNGITL